MKNPSLVELKLGVVPEAAISGAVLLQTEQQAFLTFNAMRETTRPTPYGGFYREDAGTAIVELVGCTITRFGYPNDEAWSYIPLTKDRAYGVFEVMNSPWMKELAQLNRFAFPETKEWMSRHFIFLFHDSSLECIATDLRLELSSEPYHRIIAKLVARAIQ